MNIKTIKLIYGLFLFFLPTLLPAQQYDYRNQRLQIAENSPEPDSKTLMGMRSDRITRALQSPESLFEFVTRAEPFYLERRAAAMQGRSLIPMEWVPKLWQAMGELRRAERVNHDWFLLPPPMTSGFFPEPSEITAVPLTDQVILGYRWIPPKKTVEYPLTPAERERAPWPWQVQKALPDLYRGLVPSTYKPLDRAKAEAYLAAVLTMPCGTDDEAQNFWQAAQYSSHFKTPTIMGALRNIALNRNYPQAAVQVSYTFADATRLWDNPDSWAIGNAGTLDILRNSPHAEARKVAIEWIRSLRKTFRNGAETSRPLPAAVILEASRLAFDSATTSEWNRLAGYTYGVVEALDDSPFRAEDIDTASPLVAQRLKAFRLWYNAERPQLKALARKQAGEVERGAHALKTSKCR